MNEITTNTASPQAGVDVEQTAIPGEPFPKSLSKQLAAKEIADEKLHQYCLYALRQCIEHGNIVFAIRLLEMLGKRHATQRKIAWWFCTFGTFRINKEGRLVYRKRRGIASASISECMARADAIPFYSDKLGAIKIAKLTTAPVDTKKINKEYEDGQSASVWAVSGGLPSLGKRR